MKVLQSGGHQLRILMLLKNPKEIEIWYTYGRFIDHNTCKNITKFFQRENNSHGMNILQINDDFDQILFKGSIKKGEWIGVKTVNYLTLERSNRSRIIDSYEQNIT